MIMQTLNSYQWPHLGASLMAVAQCWRRVLAQVLADDGLSDATALPLVALLRRGDGVRQGELAGQIGVDGTSVVRILDTLEKNGLVRRECDADDRRAKRIFLTDDGRALAIRCENTLGELRAELLEAVPETDLEATERVLYQLTAALNGHLQKRRGG